MYNWFGRMNMEIQRMEMPRIGSKAVFVLSFLLLLFHTSCQKKEEMKGNVFRIGDNLEQVQFIESPLEALLSSKENQVLSEKERAIYDAAETFIAESLNQDFIQGKSIHPLSLKITKPPSVGSGKGLRTKNVILAPPKTVFSIKRDIMQDSVLSFGYAVVNKEWENKQDAVKFSVYAENLKSGERTLLFKRKLNPWKAQRHRRWFLESIDLKEFRGQKINLIFETSTPSKKTNLECLSVWDNPAIVEGNERKNRLNVILISIDTLRADHLGCYGYSRNTSPNIDSLAEEGILFRNTIAQAPYTLSSHISLLTSLYPSFHKVNDIEGSWLNPIVFTLAEMFYNAGYRTWAITGGGQVSSSYGFSEGFETYIEYSGPVRDVEQKVRETIQFLEREKSSNFFIFFHSYKPHAPYSPRPPFDRMFFPDYDGSIDGELETIDFINKGDIPVTQNDIDYIVSLYDGEIREMDNALGKLFDFIKKDGLESNTLIVFTSDHGEEFNEHGKVGIHSHTLFDELILIPLVIKLPGVLPQDKIIFNQVQSIDILPSILQLAGISYKGMEFQGSSLIDLIQNSGSNNHPDYAFSERLARDGDSLRAARSLNHKFIHKCDKSNRFNGYHYFYNLNTDPREQNSLDLPRKSSIEWLKKIQFLIEEERTGKIKEKKKKVDDKTLEALKALGYIK